MYVCNHLAGQHLHDQYNYVWLVQSSAVAQQHPAYALVSYFFHFSLAIGSTRGNLKGSSILFGEGEGMSLELQYDTWNYSILAIPLTSILQLGLQQLSCKWCTLRSHSKHGPFYRLQGCFTPIFLRAGGKELTSSCSGGLAVVLHSNMHIMHEQCTDIPHTLFSFHAKECWLATCI